VTTPDPAARFDQRVADYVSYRPDYPIALVDWLHADGGVDAQARVADIGAGTGISSKLLLDAGHVVIAVEPNAAMRAAAIAWLGKDPRFTAVDGRAEMTTLADASVDLVASAQALHWFDRDAVRREWRRILGPGGLAAIWWNTRPRTGTPFAEDYEVLLHAHSVDYAMVSARHPDNDAMRAWFGDGLRATTTIAHPQSLDFDQLRGRLMSSSSVPLAGDARHAPMLDALHALFDRHAIDGRVRIDLQTRVFVGVPDAP
jgi:SAM-dependent methyltransferase